VSAPVIEAVAYAAQQNAFDDEEVVAEPLTSGTSPESLTATMGKRPALDLDRLFDAAADEPDLLAREAPEGRAGILGGGRRLVAR
jgi:hypothetical protein